MATKYSVKKRTFKTIQDLRTFSGKSVISTEETVASGLTRAAARKLYQKIYDSRVNEEDFEVFFCKE